MSDEVEVRIERYVEQVCDGTHYKGYLIIASNRFDYELKFAVPIPKLDDMEMPQTRSEIRSLFEITIKRDEAVVDLSEDEFGFFFQLIAELAVHLYNNPQTRSANRGHIGDLLRRRDSLSAFGVSAKIGMTNSGSLGLPPDICEMLSTPKFGCSLLV